MPFFHQHNVRLRYEERGEGLPFVFQHGLGGDVQQPLGLFRPPRGIRLLVMDFRGHGLSELGPEAEISFTTFASDVNALFEHLAISSAIVGGISMGAAVALHFALKFPGRVLGLALSRPAWLDHPNPRAGSLFGEIARLLETQAPQEGLERFRRTAEYTSIAAEYPDTAKSLEGQFLRPRAQETRAILQRMPSDQPYGSRREWKTISQPTLLMANRHDPIHPYEYAETLAASIPGAELRELASKSLDAARHQEQVQEYLEEFVTRHFSDKTN